VEYFLAPRDRDPRIVVIKDRLGIVPSNDEFDERLAQRIRGLQAIHGLEVNSRISEELIRKVPSLSDIDCTYRFERASR